MAQRVLGILSSHCGLPGARLGDRTYGTYGTYVALHACVSSGAVASCRGW